jgi:hypothetical protein
MPYNITPILSTGPLNSNVGFNNSWITVDNDFNRPLFAQLTYDTKSAESQQQIINLLSRVDANTDHLEDLIGSSNDFLNLIYAFEDIINNNLTDTKTLLTGSQNELILTVRALTANIDLIKILNTSLTSIQVNKQDQLINLGNSLTSSNVRIPGFGIPPYDEIDIQYVNNTNNIQRVSYFNNSTNVLSLSFTYIPNPPINDNAILKNVKKI